MTGIQVLNKFLLGNGTDCLGNPTKACNVKELQALPKSDREELINLAGQALGLTCDDGGKWA